MSIKNKLIIYLPLTLIFALLLRYLLTYHKTGNNIPAASPTPSERAESCAPTIVSAYLKNKKEIQQQIVGSRQFKWNDNKFNLTVFECPDSDKYTYPRVLALTKMNNAGTEETALFSMADEIFNLEDNKIADINKDGLAELVISHSNGGNCPLCGGFSVFQITGDKVNDLLEDFPKPEGGQYAMVWVSDLNNDGIDEILVDDDSFALTHNFLHYTAPIRTAVFTWKDNSYQDASQDFSRFYLEQINKRNQSYKTLLTAKKTELDIATGRIQQIAQIAIENFFDYSSIGKPDLGYDTFTRQIDISGLNKTVTVSDSDKIFLQEIKNDIESEYLDAKPTKALVY